MKNWNCTFCKNSWGNKSRGSHERHEKHEKRQKIIVFFLSFFALFVSFAVQFFFSIMPVRRFRESVEPVTHRDIPERD